MDDQRLPGTVSEPGCLQETLATLYALEQADNGTHLLLLCQVCKIVANIHIRGVSCRQVMADAHSAHDRLQDGVAESAALGDDRDTTGRTAQNLGAPDHEVDASPAAGVGYADRVGSDQAHSTRLREVYQHMLGGNPLRQRRLGETGRVDYGTAGTHRHSLAQVLLHERPSYAQGYTIRRLGQIHQRWHANTALYSFVFRVDREHLTGKLR